MRKLLWVMVCLHAIMSISEAAGYVEYKTAKHSTCSNREFAGFNIDRTSNNLYAVGDTELEEVNLTKYVMIWSSAIYRISSSGLCKKIGTFRQTVPYPFETTTLDFLSGNHIAVDGRRRYIYKEEDGKLLQADFGSNKLARTISVPFIDKNSILETDKYGNIYILNPSKSILYKYSFRGRLLFKIGGKGSYNGKFNNPTSLAIDKNNYIYISDSGNSRIQKFNASGHFVTKWGHAATADEAEIDPYAFHGLGSIGVDANSKVYAQTSGIQGGLIKKYYSNDDYISKSMIEGPMSHAKIDTSGNVYSLYKNGIVKLDKYGRLKDAWGGVKGSGALGYTPGNHFALTDMVFDSQNNMYTFDSKKYLIQKFSKSGRYLKSWGGFGGNSNDKPIQNGKITSPYNSKMAINNYDEIYITSSLHRVYRFNKDGRLLQTLSYNYNNDHHTRIHSIDTDKYNNVYVLYVTRDDNHNFHSYVAVYSRYFKRIRTFEVGKNKADDDYYYDISIDKKRNVLYAQINNSVEKYTLSGRLLTGWTLQSGSRWGALHQTVFNNGSLGYVTRHDLHGSPGHRVFTNKILYYSNTGILLKVVNSPYICTVIKEDHFGSRYLGHAVSHYTVNYSSSNPNAFDKIIRYTGIYKKSVNPDIDHDGVPNERDAFPFNKREWLDTDHDGIGNNADKDDDNDGLLDTVERAHKLNPLNPRDAKADFDHDGFTNAQEINAGTNIRSAKSRPTWVPIIIGDIVTFTLPKR